MSAYRYVVFPRGKQPGADEVRQWQALAGALGGQFAWGTCRDDGRLALAADRRSFDHVRSSDAGFAALIDRWETRGCEVVEHLAFVKDAAALRPAPVAPLHRSMADDGKHPVRFDQRIAAKELAAKEAIGRSMLSVERTIQQYAVVERLAAALPYALVAIAAATTLAAGLYVRHAMQDSGRERRQETIERVARDALEEPLGGGVSD